MRNIIFALIIILMAQSVASAKYESTSQDAASIVLYGYNGTDIVPIAVNASGKIETTGGSGGFTNGSDITTGNVTVNNTIKTPSGNDLTIAPGTGILNVTGGASANIGTPAGNDLNLNPATGVVVINNTISTPAGIDFKIANSTGDTLVEVNATNANVEVLKTIQIGATAFNATLGIKQPTNAITGGIILEAATGSRNGGIFHDNNGLVLREFGGSIMWMNATRVGIGTTAPISTCQVNGTLTVGSATVPTIISVYNATNVMFNCTLNATNVLVCNP